ncbi:MAG TPA: NAD-dependent epimerase/dehydratase family protein [Clostridia bacterium]|nr:NAD-dependent epimerase/dehydratase family protein [Clostridia bacterium]
MILRVADIYGPRNTPLSTPILFLRQALMHRPLTVFGQGTQGRTYTYVSDFVEGVLLALNNKNALGCIMNLGSGQFVTMLELAEAVHQVTGRKSKVVHDPSVPSDRRHLEIDIQKARRILGFIPRVKLEEGLKMTYDWMKDNLSYYSMEKGLIQ